VMNLVIASRDGGEYVLLNSLVLCQSCSPKDRSR
jgi:hypothetical protein